MNMQAIWDRRSIRAFKPDAVPLPLVQKILEAGRAAPSGKNRQPWRFVVYGGRPKADLLAAMGQGILREREGTRALLPESAPGLGSAVQTLRIMRKAPLLIVVLNANGKSPLDGLTTDQRFTELVDTLSIGAAIENMLLQAQALGLGTLWIANTCFAYPELTAAIGTPHQLVGAVALGYAAEAPEARPRKPLEVLTEYRL